VRYILTGEKRKRARHRELAAECLVTARESHQARPSGRKSMSPHPENVVTLLSGPRARKTYLAVAAAFSLRDKSQPHHSTARVEGGTMAFCPEIAEQGRPLPRPLVRCLLTCWARRPIRNIWSGANFEWPRCLHAGRTLDDSFIILDEAQTPPASR
jgi:hypothetical protein